MSSTPAPNPESADGDAVYIEKTLRHAPTDLLLDDAVSDDVIKAAWRRSIRLALGLFAVFLVIWLISGGMSTPFSSSSSVDDESSAILVAGMTVGIFAFVVTWVVFLVSEKQEAISEWCTLLADKAPAADSVYSHVVGRLRERRIPVHHFFTRRTRTPIGVTGNRLVLIDGYHYAYVSVFAYGTGLYLGWSLWRIRRGSTLLAQYLGVRQGNRYDPVARILNLERLKAVREAVHAVCREALHTAIRDVHVAEGYGFPQGMPMIEELPFGTAPAPNQP